MSGSTRLSLGGGHVSTVEDWEKSAAAVLRKAGRMSEDDPDSEVWTRLTRTTLDGVEVPPLGTAALVADLPGTGLPGRAPYTRGTRAEPTTTGWDIRPVHADPDPARTAAAVLADLENGATSVWLTLGAGGIAPDDLPTVLDGVMLDLAPVVLECPEDPLGAADALAGVLSERELQAAPGTNLGGDPVGARTRGLREALGADELQEVVGALAGRATELRSAALVVDGTAVHDLGASDVQELGYALAVGAAYLRALVAAGHDVDHAAALIEFRYAATAEQFPTIAKLRAARRLWHRVTELSGVSPGARGQVQHAVTSRPMMSKYDPWVNMLRTTIATFAAGVGGASAVTVLPFDAALGLPDAFARRIARNTSSLLISESHVSRVTDPAGGAHAVERLTDDLARAAWEELGRIEEAGGVLAALDDGSLRARVAEVAEERAARIARREQSLTGVNEYPHLHEKLPERTPHPEGSVPVARYGAAFEALRDDPAPTPVFLATLGRISAHTARATFAANLLAAGGVDVAPAGATEGVDDVLAAYDGQPVVALAGTDAAYADWGAPLVAALREAGARWVILAGRAPEGVDVDDTCAVGVDALAFLHRTRARLDRPDEETR